MTNTLIFICLLTFFLQLIYLTFQWIQLRKPTVPTVNSTASLSVVVIAKNERNNLLELIPLLLKQDYPEFEIILVDDHSTDNGILEIESKFKSDKIKTFNLPEGISGKKQGVKYAVEQAKNNWLVFTDADCKPASEFWLKSLSTAMCGEKELILGYSRYYKENGFLNKLIRYETVLSGIQYLALATAGKPILGVGRNIAYTKEFYKRGDNARLRFDIRSGDDDLLVNAKASGDSTGVVYNKNSHTVSIPKRTWKAYFMQKRRHIEAGHYYKNKDRLFLGALGLMYLLFYLTLFLQCLMGLNLVLICLIFAIKQVYTMLVYHKLLVNLEDRDLVIWLPILEPFYLIILSLIGLSVRIWKIDRWK